MKMNLSEEMIMIQGQTQSGLSRTSRLEESVEEIKYRVCTIETGVEGLKTDFKLQRSDIEALKIDVTGIRFDMQEIKLSIKAMNTEMGYLKETFASKLDLQVLDHRLTGKMTELDVKLTGKITDLEARVLDMKSSIIMWVVSAMFLLQLMPLLLKRLGLS
jgi:wobble nucleotide-excising tRNase